VGFGRQKVTWPDGETQIVDLNPGMVAWRDDPLEHAWELLAGEVHVIWSKSSRRTLENKHR
jgi:hypothetical protein